MSWPIKPSLINSNLFNIKRKRGIKHIDSSFLFKTTIRNLTPPLLESISEVNQRKPLILAMSDPEFYKEISQKKLEHIRTEIRDLVIFLAEDSPSPLFFTDFTDTMVGDGEVREGNIEYQTTNEGYKKRIETFVRAHKNHLTIHKLQHNEAITEKELGLLEEILFADPTLGSKEDFTNAYGNQPLGKFVRSLLGLTTEAAQAAFSQFVQTGNLSANQIKFVETIVHYLEKNGTLDKSLLTASPFNNQHSDGIFGVFQGEDQKLMKVISIVNTINDNAEIG
jgi:type I restriction enzyme, R subunit